ncbi:PEGA domain-containing protein [Pendulispora albinea]|uniref:PEGA domain-containing protein n=1 Tax=Pendulispora albinea TaxID=2741071 RepID=A0ABZ2M5I9_9BACT
MLPFRHRLVFGLATALLLASPPLAAQSADALIAHGVTLREQGRDEEALAEFRKAYAVAPTPRAQAQMGLAEQALGLWTAAEEHVRAALGAESDPWIAKNRAPLAQSLKTIEQHLGTLDVRGPAGAEVFVDGGKVGQLPLAHGLRLEAGGRTLELRAPGYQSTSRMVTILPDKTARETIELRPLRRPDPDQTTVPGQPPPRASNPPPDAKPGSTQRTVGWILTGAGGAAIVTGIVGLIVRNAEVSGYNDDPQCPGMNSPLPNPPQCQSHVSAADRWKIVGIAGLAAGAALGGTGVALVLTAPSGPHATAGISFSGKF